jgi:predicted RNase H-like HicB family nuclease
MFLYTYAIMAWKEAAPETRILLESRYPARRGRTCMVRQFETIVEKHSDGYVAYPLGLTGVVVGEGDTYEDALANVRSAIAFHIETFGPGVLETESTVLEAFVAEAGIKREEFLDAYRDT